MSVMPDHIPSDAEEEEVPWDCDNGYEYEMGGDDE
jgi:hypothetical protein